jgi:hypothetical protein
MFGELNQRCTGATSTTVHTVSSQLACQQDAISSGHVFYSYRHDEIGHCWTSASCVPTSTPHYRWAVYTFPGTTSTGEADETTTTAVEGLFATCGRRGECSGTAIHAATDTLAVRCVSNVAKDGWHHKQEEPSTCPTHWQNIWWESDLWGSCQILDYTHAVAFCASQEARLPTLQEAENGCVAGSGCDWDSQLIWTAQVCENHDEAAVVAATAAGFDGVTGCDGIPVSFCTSDSTGVAVQDLCPIRCGVCQADDAEGGE